jgi:hypothetical protein
VGNVLCISDVVYFDVRNAKYMNFGVTGNNQYLEAILGFDYEKCFEDTGDVREYFLLFFYFMQFPAGHVKISQNITTALLKA